MIKCSGSGIQPEEVIEEPKTKPNPRPRMPPIGFLGKGRCKNCKRIIGMTYGGILRPHKAGIASQKSKGKSKMERLTNGELENFKRHAEQIIEDLERTTIPLSDYGKRQLLQAQQSLLLVEEVKLYRTH